MLVCRAILQSIAKVLANHRIYSLSFYILLSVESLSLQYFSMYFIKGFT